MRPERTQEHSLPALDPPHGLQLLDRMLFSFIFIILMLFNIPMLTLLPVACAQEERVLQGRLVLLDSPVHRVELEQLERLDSQEPSGV